MEQALSRGVVCQQTLIWEGELDRRRMILFIAIWSNGSLECSMKKDSFLIWIHLRQISASTS